MKNSDFSFLLTRYLTHYLPVQRNLSSNTIRSYRDTFKQLLEFCRDEKNINIIRLTIHQVDKKCIEDFFLWLQKCREISPSTYNQRLCAVHAFFEYIMMEKPEYMEHCRQILKIPNLKAPKPSAKYLTTDALKSILAAPDTTTKQGRRHLVILTVLYDTAARVSELSDIRIKDVRLEYPSSITLHGKGHKVRTVPIMKQTTALLKKYFNENRINSQIHSDMPLFWNVHGQKLSRSGITYIIQKYADVVRNEMPGIPSDVSPHMFRHTKAMHLVQANVNPIYIKDYLGHTDISTTMIYAHADNETKRAVLEKASEQFNLPKTSNWEQNTDLIDWLSSL